MRYILIILLNLAYTQCDANDDGELNVIDVVQQVDCILTGCWDTEYEDGPDYEDYATVLINGQLWMAENLRTTHFSNGDPIPYVEWSNQDGLVWTYNYEPAYAKYDEDPDNAEVYGKLYNQFAVEDERGLCPVDWHVASQEEYMELANYLGGEGIAGYRMKDNTWDGDNQVNFSGLPAGCRASGPANGDCCMGTLAHLWTSANMIYAELETNRDDLRFKSKDKRAGKSVRCVAD